MEPKLPPKHEGKVKASVFLAGLAQKKEKLAKRGCRINKQKLSAYAIRVLAVIADLDKNTRTRVLKHAFKMNIVK